MWRSVYHVISNKEDDWPNELISKINKNNNLKNNYVTSWLITNYTHSDNANIEYFLHFWEDTFKFKKKIAALYYLYSR